MDNYLNSFRKMISLRGLTDHTLKSYCTYIRTYLDYLNNILHKSPEEVSWDELRDYICWLQKSRDLSDRTINGAISKLRFFTLYVLHKPWAGLMNTFLSSLQKKKPGSLFLPCLILSLKPWLPSCTLLVFVSGKSAASVMKMLTANICAFTSHTLKTEMTGMPFFLKQPLTF